MIHWRLAAAGLLACAAGWHSAEGADYFLTAEVGQVLGADLTPTELPPAPASAEPGVDRVYRIDFKLHTGGFDAEADQRGFGNILFDVALEGANVRPHPSLTPSWRASDEQTPDLNGEAAGGVLPVWDMNSDGGAADDLRFIIASIDVIPTPVPEDPRPHLGESEAALLGSVYVDWNGIGLASISVTPLSSGGVPQASYARISDGALVLDGEAVVSGDTLRLFASADFEEDGDVDGGDLETWSEHFGSPDPATHGQGDATGDGLVDGADFLVWQRQFYVLPEAEVRSVPEAPTAVLGAMAAAVLAGSRRRGGRAAR